MSVSFYQILQVTRAPVVHDERPDRGYCKKVPISVCAVAYDRCTFYNYGIPDYILFPMELLPIFGGHYALFSVWNLFPDYRITQCKSYFLFQTKVVLYQIIVIFSILQFQLQKWLDAPHLRRTTSVPFLELVQQVQVYLPLYE